MAEALPIIQLGNPILRESAPPILDPDDADIQALIDDLIETAYQTNGVGIAAPQVGRSHRLFVVASRPNLRYPHAPSMEPTAMINPRIISHSEAIVKGWEGCLSVPELRGFVPRYETVDVEYSDRQGQLCRQQLSGFVARIFQHEYDHIEGRVFVDRLETTQELMSEREYHKRIVLGEG
jgi:peptide deformylase